jgi:7,8-dihydropterin-6-yl-methyl-4-(beta-D-ribofuranosyl)aminobenzene 5'-phosphate synthase
MRVTSLVENSGLEGREDLHPEFGMSMLAEVGETKILFDMGATAVFAGNAAALELDIADVDVAVVSHQHFDHGGGLEHFLENNDHATVFLRRAPVTDRRFKALGLIDRPIGLDRSVLERFSQRIDFVEGMRLVAPGVYLLTDIGSAHPRPNGNRRLFAVVDGAVERDPFDHEMMMVVHEDDGMTVFSGCSHSGILNLIDAATAQFPRVPIKAVFGGFHLIGLPFYNSMAASRTEVREIGWKIVEKVQGTVYSGHCTGAKAFAVLAGVMGDSLRPFPTGASAEV